MINKKLLIGLAALSIFYAGCEEKETTQMQNTSVVEKTEKKIETEKKVSVDTVEKNVKVVQKKIVEITDANILFKKCSSCHGLNAEKKALNNSQVIKDWDASQIKDALHGYKDGTYGGKMKNAMISQVSTLSDKQIDILATHISSFK